LGIGNAVGERSSFRRTGSVAFPWAGGLLWTISRLYAHAVWKKSWSKYTVERAYLLSQLDSNLRRSLPPLGRVYKLPEPSLLFLRHVPPMSATWVFLEPYLTGASIEEIEALCVDEEHT